MHCSADYWFRYPEWLGCWDGGFQKVVMYVDGCSHQHIARVLAGWRPFTSLMEDTCQLPRPSPTRFTSANWPPSNDNQFCCEQATQPNHYRLCTWPLQSQWQRQHGSHYWCPWLLVLHKNYQHTHLTHQLPSHQTTKRLLYHTCRGGCTLVKSNNDSWSVTMVQRYASHTYMATKPGERRRRPKSHYNSHKPNSWMTNPGYFSRISQETFSVRLLKKRGQRMCPKVSANKTR